MRSILLSVIFMSMICCSGCFVKFVAVDKPRPIIPTDNLVQPIYDIPDIPDLNGDGMPDPTPEQKVWINALKEETQFGQKCHQSILEYNKDANRHNEVIFKILNSK